MEIYTYIPFLRAHTLKCHAYRNIGFGSVTLSLPPVQSHIGLYTRWPSTLKFDRVTQPFLKFDRRHWTLLKSTERNKK